MSGNQYQSGSRKKHRKKMKNIDDLIDEQNELQDTDRGVRNASPIKDPNRFSVNRVSDTMDIIPISINKSTQ